MSRPDLVDLMRSPNTNSGWLLMAAIWNGMSKKARQEFRRRIGRPGPVEAVSI